MAHKLIIYQLFVRLFGNKTTECKYNGSLEENGVGKFCDITTDALRGLKKMGISHIWYTGVIDYATTTNYSNIGLPGNNQSTIKGKAGSPYAIRDYYNVSPDLATNTVKRMEEFEDLVKRTHTEGLKVLIDFVPNHVAREYKSVSKPKNVKDLGQGDNNTKSFSPKNNFYYIPNSSLLLPNGNGEYQENPAKATGNDVFSNTPSNNDWFETVKLNYGIDYNTGERYFNPTPSTWKKMLDILVFWVNKGVDGFRCDMCEMVPVEFWNYAITKIKKKNSNILFIGEAYNPGNYRTFLDTAGFNLLYNKVGLYDYLKGVIKGENDFSNLKEYYAMVNGIENRMLSFLENHDEERIASPFFAGNPFYAIPIMTIASCISNAPVMIYSGQEFGATGMENTGYSGADGRTSIFDYTNVPELQKWVNGGFSSGLLSESEKNLFEFYNKLLNATKHEAISDGSFYDLQWVNNKGQSEGFNAYKNFAFVRYTYSKRVIVVSTVDNVPMKAYLKLHKDVFNWCALEPHCNYQLTDLLTNKKIIQIKGENLLGDTPTSGILINLPAKGACILDLTQIK